MVNMSAHGCVTHECSCGARFCNLCAAYCPKCGKEAMTREIIFPKYTEEILSCGCKIVPATMKIVCKEHTPGPLPFSDEDHG